MNYQIDMNDSKALWDFSLETVELAEKYAQARLDYAEAIKQLKLGLAKAYADGTIKESLSEDKAYLLLSNLSEEFRIDLEKSLLEEQNYKGLEKVLDARQAIISFNQSIIKNTPK